MSRPRPGLAVAALLITASVAVVGAACFTANAPAQAAAPSASGAPSLFVPIDSFRTMDSRIEQPATKIPRTVDGQNMPIPRYVSFDLAGPVSPVPDNATAVTYNITVTDTEGAGFAQVDLFTAADGSTSTVNWTGAGQTDANSGVTQLEPLDGPPGFGIYVGGTPDAKTHIVVDITGYYIPADAG